MTALDIVRPRSRALGVLLLAVLLAACGGPADTMGPPAAGDAARAVADGPVDSEEAAIAAVRAHLAQIASCRAARARLERDVAQGRFSARLVAARSYWSAHPVWEVTVASDQHVPYLTWFVEQSDGTVLASIGAATYYESPLLHTCGRA